MAIIRRNCFYFALSVCAFALFCAGVHAQSTFYTTPDDAKETPPGVQAPAAYSLVNGFTTCTGTTLVSSITTTGYPFGGSAVKNNLIFIVVSNTGAATRSVSAPFGMITALDDTTVDSRPSQSLFYKVAVGGEGFGSNGFQISFGAPTRACYSFYEFSGTSWNSPLHGVANASGLFESTLITGTASPFTVGDLLVAGFFNTRNGNWTASFSSPTNGFTFQDAYTSSSGVSIAGASSYHLSGGTASTSLFINNLGTGWRGQIASFYPKTATSSTGTGSNQTVTAGNATLTFSNVTGSGTTTSDSIDPTNPSQGAAPTGITYSSTSPAYNISTTATFTGSVSVCISAATITDQPTFNNLKLLHKEGATLVDRTTSVNFSTKTVCGSVTTLSPFIVANGSAPTAATVSVSGRVLTADGRGLRNAYVVLTDQNGVWRTALSSSFGYYRFDDVQAGATYVIGVSSKRYQFTPRAVSVTDDLTDVDFVADP